MKQTAKRLLALAAAAVLLCSLLALTGCGAAKYAAEQDAVHFDGVNNGFEMYDEAEPVSRAYAAADSKSAESVSESAPAPAPEAESMEKIVRTVELDVQTEGFDDYMAGLQAAVRAASGYLEESSVNSGGYYSDRNRNAYVVARIPAADLDAFLAKAGEGGVIISREESATNVTLEYVDLESRISAYKTEQKTLMKLLEKADQLEDILKIQERLSEVNYQLESYSAKLRVLENRVSYSTVTLHVSEVNRALSEDDSLGTRIKNRFLENWDALKDGCKGFVVGLIGGLPILLPLGVFAAVVIVVIVKLCKRRKAKKAAAAQPPQDA